MFDNESGNNQIWIALISALAGIFGALGVKEWVPSIIDWFKFKRNAITKLEQERKAEVKELHSRIDKLDADLQKERMIVLQTKSTLEAFLPIMRHMMKEHPEYLELLDKLEVSIFGKPSEDLKTNKTPAS